MLSRAERDQLDALAAIGLVTLGVEPALLDVKRRTKQAAIRSIAVHAARVQVARALAARGIQRVFLKGSVGDVLWWGGQGLRGTTDIDVLIPRRRVEDAHEALGSLGYRRVLDEAHPVTEDSKPERLYLHPERGAKIDVDLHLGVMKSPPYEECASELLARARTYESSFGPVVGLEKEDMLAHAAGNLAGSKFAGRLKLALDAACLLSDPELDLAVVVERVQRWRCGWALWALLSLANERFGVPVPGWALRELQPKRGARLVVDSVAGIGGAPRVPTTGLGRLVLVEWPVLGRPLWPLQSGARWAALRMRDRLRSSRVVE